MKVAVIIPFRGDPQSLQWTLAGYAAQVLGPGNSLEIRVGIDGEAAPEFLRTTAGRSVVCEAYPRMGAGAVRNALVNGTSADTDLVIFGNADARPEPDMVQRHIDAMQTPAAHAAGSMVLGSAPWESPALPLVWHALLEETPAVFFYNQLEAGKWYDFRHAWTLNLSVRRADFIACGGFVENIRPVYYEDLALGFRLLGKERMGVLYEPRARVVHRHPTTLDQYLDREELLGIMAPVLARNSPNAFGIIFGTRDLETLARGYRHWIEMDGAMHKWIYKRLADFAAQPAESLGPPASRERTLMALYQMHIPLKRLAFRLGFLKGLKLAEDAHWRERKAEGLWRKIVL